MTKEEAIKRIKDWNLDNNKIEVLSVIIPELKECEDERMLKAIIGYIDHDQHYGVSNKEMIAWLEKQGVQKFVDKCKKCNNVKGCITCTDGDQYAHITEQKPTDKVEPKFNVGDWIVTPDNKVKQIEKVTFGNYWFTDESLYNIIDVDNKGHLWAIKDAKDGDVLSFNDGHGNDGIELIKSITDKKIEFWFCLTNGSHYEVFDGITPYTNFASREKARPATKEQRDLLFQKMKEKGYEWDAEKKEMRKIEQKNVLEEAFDKSRKDYSLEEKKEASDYSESIIPTSIAYGESKEEYMLHKIIEAAFIAGQNIKQKSPWSEEDEQNLNVCLGYISDESLKRWLTDIIHIKYLNKSIPEVNPAWSDGDEERYVSCLQRLGTGNLKQPETINTVWLKSLKERVQLV